MKQKIRKKQGKVRKIAGYRGQAKPCETPGLNKWTKHQQNCQRAKNIRRNKKENGAKTNRQRATKYWYKKKTLKFQLQAKYTFFRMLT